MRPKISRQGSGFLSPERYSWQMWVLSLVLSGFLLGLQSCKSMQGGVEATPDKNKSEKDKTAEILAQEKFNCERQGLIYDQPSNKCIDAYVYCKSLKDGSSWDEPTKQCLTPEMSCKQKTGYAWSGGSCQRVEAICKQEGATIINGTCVRGEESCLAAGGRYKWVADEKLAAKGSCRFKSFFDYCQDKAASPFSDTITILRITASATTCAETHTFLKNQISLRLIAPGILEAYDKVHGSDLENKIKLVELGPLAEFINLQTLELTNNQISDISPLSGLVNLRYLDLQNNKITSLDGIEKLTNLESLYIGLNQVNRLDQLIFLTRLTTLDAFSNRLFDISGIKNLKSLKTLRLRGNSISSLAPLVNLSNLTEFWIDFNPISEPNFLKTQENCPVSYGVAQPLYDFCSLKN